MVSSDIATTLSTLAADQQRLADTAKSLAAQAAEVVAQQGGAGGQHSFFITGLTVFILACFVGYYVVWRVTPALHSPRASALEATPGAMHPDRRRIRGRTNVRRRYLERSQNRPHAELRNRGQRADLYATLHPDWPAVFRRGDFRYRRRANRQASCRVLLFG